MPRCTVEIKRKPQHAEELYDLRVWDGSKHHALGTRNSRELLFRLQEMTFVDGSTPEKLHQQAVQTGSSSAQIEWPD